MKDTFWIVRGMGLTDTVEDWARALPVMEACGWPRESPPRPLTMDRVLPRDRAPLVSHGR
jgi:hypothetical protein